MSSEFAVTAYGKWILAGEHTVLRGGAALVFPFKAKSMILEYVENNKELTTEFSGLHGSELQLLFWGVLEKAVELLKRPRQQFTGHMKITSSLPIGAGLGASAALCVALGKWCLSKEWIVESELHEFSRALENLFHGESSGVDIAAAIACHPIRFSMEKKGQEMSCRWKPNWYLSYSGQRGMTSECVAKVKELRVRNRELSEEIDQDMRESVALAEKSLAMSESEGTKHLVDAINTARSCFERWGLVSGKLSGHIQMLLEKGAWTAKPTGSGDGGFVISLWRHTPPDELKNLLIPV
jgi:mevalonate kinase